MTPAFQFDRYFKLELLWLDSCLILNEVYIVDLIIYSLPSLNYQFILRFSINFSFNNDFRLFKTFYQSDFRFSKLPIDYFVHILFHEHGNPLKPTKLLFYLNYSTIERPKWTLIDCSWSNGHSFCSCSLTLNFPYPNPTYFHYILILTLLILFHLFSLHLILSILFLFLGYYSLFSWMIPKIGESSFFKIIILIELTFFFILWHKKTKPPNKTNELKNKTPN